MPRPNEDTELDMRLWPVAEKRETAGDAGADELTVNGDWGGRESPFASRLPRFASGGDDMSIVDGWRLGTAVTENVGEKNWSRSSSRSARASTLS